MSGAAVLPGWHPAPAAGVTPPSPPVPGSPAARVQAAKAIGARVGRVHGEFRAWLENFLDMFTTTGVTGGIPAWIRLPPQRQQEAIALVQKNYDSLPRLPPAATTEEAAAMRDGFLDAVTLSYEADQFMNRAVWAACELAKAVAIAGASTQSVSAIGSFADKFSDCAAQTASRAILEMTGTEVPASYLVRAFGLPRTSIAGYDAAVAYARNWFKMVGIELAPNPGGFVPVAQGGIAGRYVVFLKGGARGGHVVFGEVSTGGIAHHRQSIRGYLGEYRRGREGARNASHLSLTYS
jgi:hypothetical protein